MPSDHEIHAAKESKDILRFLTAGSVDDGKSTLIGRLLFDSKQITDDHLESLKRDSSKKGWESGTLDYSLLMDGLKAEREQNITIDVAYRYFSTPQRKFIIADAPGHEQYTQNMITAASNANLLLLLISAQNGILPQTRRHSFIASLMGIKHLIIAINKMDLVDYSPSIFEKIKNDYIEFANGLPIHDIHFIPLSAVKGDNVVEPSIHMPWHQGKPLLRHLEEIHIANDRNLMDLRFPVQLVLRPHQNFRGYAGTLASGILKKGDEVVVLPSGQRSRVRSIMNYKEELLEAFPPQSVTLELENDLDISRGDMIVHLNNQPQSRDRLEAMLMWMNAGLIGIPENSYLLKTTTQTVSALLNEIAYKIDINTLDRQKEEEKSGPLFFNEIARVKLSLHRPIFTDTYETNRTTGSFILIDPLSNQTVAAGIIIDGDSGSSDGLNTSSIKSSQMTLPKNLSLSGRREKQLNQKGCVIWLTGLSGSGKTTLAYGLEKQLHKEGRLCTVLDGDLIRQGLNRDLGFSPEDRCEHVRRVA